MTNETDHVLEFITRSVWENMPLPVQHQAKRCLPEALEALITGAAAAGYVPKNIDSPI